MAFEIRMPQLGLTMEEGTVTTWLNMKAIKLQKAKLSWRLPLIN